MKSSFRLYCFLALFLAGMVVVAPGCKNCGGTQPGNPFATTGNTAPPPATYSYSPSYLGQQPNAFSPQTPATVYNPNSSTYPPSTLQGTPIPSTTYPATVPSTSSPVPGTLTNPVQQGTPVPYSGSINGNPGASVYSAIPASNPAPASTSASVYASDPANGWTPAAITPTATGQTASQSIENQAGSVTMIAENGRISTTVGTNPLTVSSSQWITNVEGDANAATPQPNVANPVAMYSGQY